MNPRISSFMNLPTPIKAVLLVVAGGSVMSAIWLLFRGASLQVFLFLGIGIVVVVLLLLLYRFLLKWHRKRKAAPMEHSVISSASAAPQGISDAAHMARVDDLRKKFEDGIEKFRAAGKNLYDFPWYMIVGEPGSGKTEAIRHCNIGFPPGLQDQFQGAGGTLNMNWWFTDHAVILDTAGRLMFEEVETGGSSEWKEFLTLLKKSRPRCPINGVFLVIPSDSLIKDTADEIEQKASKIAKQFDIIQRSLDVRFPVFVVITKSDLINGFRDFFDSLEDPQLQHQIMGWSNPAPLDEPYNTGFIDQHLKAIRNRLFRRRLALLQDIISASGEPGAGRKQESDTLYAFPQSLAKIAPRMARYLELVFSVGSQWSCKPLFFRGIYFTSSMREGSALDEDLADSLGVPVDSLPDGRVWERDRAYFLRDLFIKKVFREKGLVTHATNAQKQHVRRKATFLITAAASVIVLLFITIYAAVLLHRSIGEIKGYLKTSADIFHSKEITIADGLQVLKHEGGHDYSFISSSPVSASDIKIRRLDFPSRLANSVNRWDIPWIFAPAAKFQKIDSKNLNAARGIVYEEGILRPFLNATRNIIDSQEGGTWTHEDKKTKALRQLIRIKAAKPLNEEGEYSDQTLLDPLFELVFQNDPEQIQQYHKDDKAKLHLPLGMIYKQRAWRPVPWAADPNSQDLANTIKHGVQRFNKYWMTVESDPVYDKADIGSLRKDLEDFNAAEVQILSLDDKLDAKAGRLSSFTNAWNESFEKLSKAKKKIDAYAVSDTLQNQQSLADLRAEQVNRLLKDVNENYEFLLSELSDVNQVEYPSLYKRRIELEDALKRITSGLNQSELAQRLSQFDKELYAVVPEDQENRRLYAIRYEMYLQANEQINVAKSVSDVNEVVITVETMDEAFKNASDKIEVLRELDPRAFRFKEASEISTSALALVKQNQLYNILQSGLKVALGSIEKTRVPEPEKTYDPNVAVDLIGGWSVLGNTLNELDEYDLPDEASLKEMYDKANAFYSGYISGYLNYWLKIVPESFIGNEIPPRNNWKAQHEQIEKVNVLRVFAKLNSLGKSIEKDALDVLEDYISDSDGRIKQFTDSLDKLNDKFFQRQCERVIENWGLLSSDAFQTRDTLLKDRPVSFVKKYFLTESPTEEFVDIYWTKLTQNSIRVLADEIEKESGKAFEGLRTQFGGKFPLERNSDNNLMPADLEKTRLLLMQALSLETYDRDTIGAGVNTQIGNVNDQLKRLREPPIPAYLETWVEAIKQIFQALPEDREPYYCKITLLNRREQDEALLGDIREIWLYQGNEEEGIRTEQLEDAVLDMTFEYPGPTVRIEFYLNRKDSDPEPFKSVEFPSPWACLRMLCSHYLERDKIGIEVEDKGTLYLKLEFYKDSDFEVPVNFPRPDQWPSLESPR
jgi:hypothetical protein